MSCLRRILAAAAVLVLGGLSCSEAALGGVSNLTISGGFTPGYTTEGTNGTLRWNPATTQHEVYVNGSWTNISGGSGGTGSGFPLTNNANFGGHGASNISFIGSETNPGDESFLMYDGTSYVHRYAAKSVTNILDLAAAIASTNKPHLYPMQLLKYTDGNVYYLAQEIDPALLGTNSYPLPGTHPAHWVVFVEKGAVGSTGLSGSDGSDGADGFGYGWITPAWSSSRGYDSNTLVSYNGRAYLSLVPNTNINPTTTNTWLLYVDKGDDGTIVGTNYLLRGTWDAGELYATNDIVEYSGNLVIVGPTNISVAGVAPSLNADGVATNSGNWSLHLARGMRGLTGAAGVDGTYTSFTNVLQVTITYSNAWFLNNPTASNDVAKWQYELGGTNYFLWGPVSTAAGTISNASSTSAWLTASVSGADIVVGATSTPIFAESDPVALAQGYQTGAGVTNAINAHATNMLSKSDASNTYVAADGYQSGSVILTGATVIVATPTASDHAATKGYVDSASSAAVTNAINAGSINATNYTGLNFLRLRGNAMFDFSSSTTIDVVFLANVVSTQETVFTKPLRVSPDTVADQRQGAVALVFASTNYDASYTIAATTMTSRPAITYLSGQTNSGGRPVYVMEEARTVASTTSSGQVGFIRQWGPTTAPDNDYFELRSLYHLWNGTAPIGGGVAFQDHPAAPSEQADIVQWTGESGGVPYFGITTIAAGGDTHTHRLLLNESYLSFNVGSANYDTYFNGDTANQQVFSLDQDTTPRIIINGNGSVVGDSTTNSSAATGVDVWVYGTSGSPMLYLNSATKGAQFGGAVNSLGGFSASGTAGISSTTSVLVADGGGGFATQTWIHIYGIRTQ